MTTTVPEITGNTTMSEAISILKQKADAIAGSDGAAAFHKDNPDWSNLFRQSYKPYEDAVKEYEEALKLNEWLNGKNPANGHLTLLQIFQNMTDQQRLTLFVNRIDSVISGIFDEYLQIWWMNRY